LFKAGRLRRPAGPLCPCPARHCALGVRLTPVPARAGRAEAGQDVHELPRRTRDVLAGRAGLRDGSERDRAVVKDGETACRPVDLHKGYRTAARGSPSARRGADEHAPCPSTIGHSQVDGTAGSRSYAKIRLPVQGCCRRIQVIVVGFLNNVANGNNALLA
jgi:hypothetical protein